VDEFVYGLCDSGDISHYHFSNSTIM
jgi:hypothetical protein